MRGTVNIERKDQIISIEIRNPLKRNALTPGILEEIRDLFHSIRVGMESARAVVIRGEGSKAFSAGYDISEIRSDGSDGQQASIEILSSTLNEIELCPVPTIASINGVCVGAACELALTCDFRLMANTGRIGTTPAKLGIVYHAYGIGKYYKLIGPSATMELFFTGRLINAERALQMNLVNSVIEMDDLGLVTEQWAYEIAQNAPLSVRAAKAAVIALNRSIKISEEDEKYLNQLRLEAYKSYDYEEGKKAFHEKRKPNFIGK
jgi:enoyl-CoA hydratase